MKFLEVTVGLTEDKKLIDLYNDLSTFLNNALLKDEYLKSVHVKKGFKYYSYSNLYPKENDRVYKKGNFYKFAVKSVDNKFLIRLKEVLNKHSYNGIMSFSTRFREKRIDFIEQIENLTPAIIIDNKKTLTKFDILLMNERIVRNSVHKYNEFYNENLDKDYPFLSNIEILNPYPIKANYKGSQLFGHKFRLLINPDPTSQKIAKFIIQVGLLEKNSLGFGFCNGGVIK